VSAEEHQQSEVPLDRLVKVLAALRGPEGCPWDRQQTHVSLRRYLIEECYEVIEAIDENDMNKLLEELGDLLLQVVFHAHIAEDAGFFDLNDVIEAISDKMIRRHPHVFGSTKVTGSEEVLANWEDIKAKERKEHGQKESALGRIPLQLPALMRAHKVQRRAARVGFDWPTVNGAWNKLLEEIAEVESAIASADPEAVAEELGDLLFAVVNVARFMQVEPELTLAATTAKFERRFEYIEQQAKLKGLPVKELTLEEMNNFWEQAKQQEKNT